MPEEEVIRMAGVKERMAVLKNQQKQGSQRATMRLTSTNGGGSGGNSFRKKAPRRRSAETSGSVTDGTDPFGGDGFGTVTKSRRSSATGAGNEGGGTGYASFSFNAPTRAKSADDADDFGFGKVERRNSAGAFTREGSKRNVDRSASAADADDFGFGKVERRNSSGAFTREGSRRSVDRTAGGPDGDDFGFGKVERRNSAGAFQRDGSRRNMNRRPSNDSHLGREGSRRSVTGGMSGKEGSSRHLSMQAVKTGSLRSMKAGSQRNVNQPPTTIQTGDNSGAAASAFPSADPFASSDPFAKAETNTDPFAKAEAFPADAFGNAGFGDSEEFGFGKPATTTTSPQKAKNDEAFGKNDDDYNDSFGDFGTEDIFGDFAGMTNDQKEEGETKAHEELDTMMNDKLGDKENTENYKGARKRYVKTIETLKPEEYEVPQEVAKDKKKARKHLRRLRQKSAVKKMQLDEIQGAWNKYDDFAQEKKLTGRRSKQYNIAEEEDDDMELQKNLDKVEREIVEEWDEFAENVQAKQKEFAPAEGEDDDSEDSDMEKWVQEAAKLKADKKALKLRQKRRHNILQRSMDRQNAAISDPVVPEELRAPPPEAEIVNEKADQPSRKKKHRRKPSMSSDMGSSRSLESSGNELTDGSNNDLDDDVSETADSNDSPPASSPPEEETRSRRSESRSRSRRSESAKRSRRRRKPRPMEDDEDEDDDDDEQITTPAAKDAKEPSPQPKPPKRNTGAKGPFAAWMNPPRKLKEEDGRIKYKCPEKTECWRKTRHNFVVDNAPFYWHKMKGDFEVTVHLTGDLGHVYDKAGLMIRVDREYWMVTTLEFFNSRYNHSTCITHDYTDWSICPIKDQEAVKSGGVWLSARKVGNTYETYHSVDGEKWIQTRQGLFHEDADAVRVGIFSACPMGPSYNIVFSDYQCEPIKI